MGFFSGIISAVKSVGDYIFGNSDKIIETGSNISSLSSSSSSGSSSSSSYVYEPDRVRAAELDLERVESERKAKLEILREEESSKMRVAQIEAAAKIKVNESERARIEAETESKIRVAKAENERIELLKRAKLEILREERDAQIAIEEARARGFVEMSHALVAMKEKMTEIASQRLMIIANGSLEIIRESENFYADLKSKLESENEKYNTQKLPKLLEILEKYEAGSTAHKLYEKRISDDLASQVKYYEREMEAISERQAKFVMGISIASEKIIDQTGQVETKIANMLEMIQVRILELESKSEKLKALQSPENLALPESV